MELGNPNLKSFRQVHIRRAMVDLGRVYVNKAIIPQTEELLSRVVEHGIDLSDNGLPNYLIGYDPEGNEAQQLGLYIEIPTDRNLDGIEENLGWIKMDNAFYYDTKAPVADLPDYDDKDFALIGSREVKLGDIGTDVKFINLYAGLESKTNVLEYDSQTADAVEYMQKKLGIDVNGEMNTYTWQSVIPKSRLRISSGHAGPSVRAFQSALICRGYKVPLTGRFGVETLRQTRRYQEENGFRLTGRCGPSEWNSLFSYA